ncbi:MAG: hypothetical protein B6I22_04985 [Desulfobacteraceae bacterium 4572_123]|nr:MAG: hypothetical protein B6I22_04985 [Desulfobacteraceae bacterium 4572_123]
MINDLERIYKKYSCVFTILAVLVMSIIIASPVLAGIQKDLAAKINKEKKSYYQASKEIAIALICTVADPAMVARNIIYAADSNARNQGDNIDDAIRDAKQGVLDGAAACATDQGQDVAQLIEMLDNTLQEPLSIPTTTTTSTTTTTTSTVVPTSPSS